MTRTASPVALVLLLLLGWPGTAAGQSSAPAGLKAAVDRLRQAIVKRDVKAVVALTPKRGIVCCDDRYTRDDLERLLARRDCYAYRLMFSDEEPLACDTDVRTASARSTILASDVVVDLDTVPGDGGHFGVSFKSEGKGVEHTFQFFPSRGRWLLVGFDWCC